MSCSWSNTSHVFTEQSNALKLLTTVLLLLQRNEATQTIFMISCVLILGCIPFRILNDKVTEDVLLIIAVPGSWFFLLFFARYGI